jgi:flagellum-specific peptidoglycan hydrolase FlgJ
MIFMAKKKTKIRKSKKNNKKKKINKIKLIIMFIFMLFSVFAYSKLINKSEDVITVDNINYYIQITDENSKTKSQLNWKEIASIDSAINDGKFQKGNLNMVKSIAEAFYDNEKKLNTFKEVLDELSLTSKEKGIANKNLEKLQKVSLRNEYEGNNEEKDKFIIALKEASINNYNTYGILPSVTISQAILESDWGNSTLASNYNNYFGIKADKSWKGKIANMNTKENFNDVISANFRAYNSKEESIYDLGKFLKGNSRYENSGLFIGSNYIEQANALENAGYATAKNEQGERIYGDMLISIIKENNLMIIDNEVEK